MLKKKTLTETIYNNGDPFQIREAISATIGAWQKQEKYQVLWPTLSIENVETSPFCTSNPDLIRQGFQVEVKAVYDDSMA